MNDLLCSLVNFPSPDYNTVLKIVKENRILIWEIKPNIFYDDELIKIMPAPEGTIVLGINIRKDYDPVGTKLELILGNAKFKKIDHGDMYPRIGLSWEVRNYSHKTYFAFEDWNCYYEEKEKEGEKMIKISTFSLLVNILRYRKIICIPERLAAETVYVDISKDSILRTIEKHEDLFEWKDDCIVRVENPKYEDEEWYFKVAHDGGIAKAIKKIIVQDFENNLIDSKYFFELLESIEKKSKDE